MRVLKSLSRLRQYGGGSEASYLRGEFRQNLRAIEEAFEYLGQLLRDNSVESDPSLTGTFTNTVTAALLETPAITTMGRRVDVRLVPTGAGASKISAPSITMTLSVVRINTVTGVETTVGTFEINSAAVPTSSVSLIDHPQAGSYRYRLMGKVSSGTGAISYSKLVASELK